MSTPADSVPPAGDDSALAGGPSPAPGLARDAEPPESEPPEAEPPEAEPAVSDATVLQALIAILVALGVGAYLLARGSFFGAGLVVLGAFYVVWLIAARSGAVKAQVVAVSLIAVFCVVWAIVSAAVYHDYHYALAVGAYGLWAFMMNVRAFADVKSRPSALLLIAGHGLALLGFLFVDLSWQLDTATALAAIVLVLTAGFSIAADQDVTPPAATLPAARRPR
jgi:hypothetical protein